MVVCVHVQMMPDGYKSMRVFVKRQIQQSVNQSIDAHTIEVRAHCTMV